MASSSKSVLILGREPALWLGLVSVITQTVSAFWVQVTPDQQAWISATAAAVVGLIVAYIVHDGIGAAVIGLVQAVIALAVGFGLDWTTGQQGIVLSLATVVVGMWTRTQVTAPVGPEDLRLATRAPAPRAVGARE
jgi:hypothetical protein